MTAKKAATKKVVKTQDAEAPEVKEVVVKAPKAPTKAELIAQIEALPHLNYAEAKDLLVAVLKAM